MADNYRNLNVTANQIEEAVEYVTANKTTINQGLSDVQNNKHDISELQSAMSNVYSRSEADNLLSEKADKSNTYTKSETDSKITEKVSEIVAGAPEDFNTLKEMSDWLTEHEDSAATMNSAIQKNKDDISAANEAIEKNVKDISNLNAGKVDKEDGKSLISDSEITRLANVDNYDDSNLKNDIAINKTTLGTQCKNLCPVNSGNTISSGSYAVGGNVDKQKVKIKAGKIVVSWKSTATSGSSEIGFFAGDTKITSVTKTNKTNISFEVTLNKDADGINLYCNTTNTFSEIMIRYADVTDDTYEPYIEDVSTRLDNSDKYIADIYNNRIGGKNLFKASDGKATSKGITTEWRNGILYVSGTAVNTEDIYVVGFPYVTTGGQMAISEDCYVTCAYDKYAAPLQLHIIRTSGQSSHPQLKETSEVKLEKDMQIGGICVKVTKGETYDFTAKLMLRPLAVIDKTFTPYIPTNAELQEQINTLTARIAALENTATTAEGGEA